MEKLPAVKIRTMHFSDSIFSLDMTRKPMFAMILISGTDGTITLTGPLVPEITSLNMITPENVFCFRAVQGTEFETQIILELHDGKKIILGETNDCLSAYAWINRVNYLYLKRSPA